MSFLIMDNKFTETKGMSRAEDLIEGQEKLKTIIRQKDEKFKKEQEKNEEYGKFFMRLKEKSHEILQHCQNEDLALSLLTFTKNKSPEQDTETDCPPSDDTTDPSQATSSQIGRSSSKISYSFGDDQSDLSSVGISSVSDNKSRIMDSNDFVQPQRTSNEPIVHTCLFNDFKAELQKTKKALIKEKAESTNLRQKINLLEKRRLEGLSTPSEPQSSSTAGLLDSSSISGLSKDQSIDSTLPRKIDTSFSSASVAAVAGLSSNLRQPESQFLIIKDLENKNKSLETELLEEKKKNQKLNLELVEERNSVTHLKSSLEDYLRAKRAQPDENQLKKQIDLLQSENNHLKGQLQEAEESRGQILNGLDKCQSENERLKKEIKVLESDVLTLKRELQEEQRNHDGRTHNLTHQLEQIRKENDDLRLKLRTLPSSSSSSSCGSQSSSSPFSPSVSVSKDYAQTNAALCRVSEPVNMSQPLGHHFEMCTPRNQNGGYKKIDHGSRQPIESSELYSESSNNTTTPSTFICENCWKEFNVHYDFLDHIQKCMND